MLKRMTSGHKMEVTLERVYTEKPNMVVERGISFISLCEHHLMPFHGQVHIAYIPHEEKVTGLSKLDQLVQKYALRLQIQERMTQQIADELEERIHPKGVMVMSEAVHTCKIIEGYPGGKYVNSVCTGVFLLFGAPREEAMRIMLGGE